MTIEGTERMTVLITGGAGYIGSHIERPTALFPIDMVRKELGTKLVNKILKDLGLK